MNTRKETSLIGHVERIANRLKDSRLAYSRVRQVAGSLEKIRKFLGCTDRQACLFCVILALNFRNRQVGIEDIADFLGYHPLKVAGFIPAIEELGRRRMIHIEPDVKKRRTMLHEIGFYVTRDMLEALFHGDHRTVQPKGDMNLVEFLTEVNGLIEDRSDKKITFETMMEEVESLKQQGHHLPFVETLDKLRLNDPEEIFLLHLCHELLNGQTEVDLISACEKIYEDANMRFHIRRNLFKGASMLVEKKLVRLQDGMFRSDREVILTEHAIQLLFDQDAVLLTGHTSSVKNLITPDMFTPTKLFFNHEEMLRLDFLKKALMESHYRGIRNRLKRQQMKTGFTVLFHGPPGTGKTESVYQIARATKRPVMKIDISQTKSMWYGESEKLIKGVFEQYRSVLGHAVKAPILLFNEADGIFSTRRRSGRSAVDQTENAIQNIILQELEDFDGILIATTNLVTNLDRAFERRFLYKIRFNKPCRETRVKIWKDKIPALLPATARGLAEMFELSGGQIENVTRKCAMEWILNGREPDREAMIRLCKEETLGDNLQRKIGFAS